MISMSTITDKGQFYASKIQQNRYMSAVSSGLSSLLPVMVIGAFSSLLSSMQLGNYQELIIPIKQYLALPAEYTTNMLAIYAVFMIANRLAHSFEKDGILAGITALISFFIVTPISFIQTETGGFNALTFDWLGAKGLFAAIIIGLISCRLYIFIIDKKLVINMPDGVPPMISKSFSSLIPTTLVCIVFVLVFALFEQTAYGSFHQAVYSILQLPLQGLGNSIWSMLIAVFLMQLLWVLGIHGAIVVMTVMTPIWTALDLENLYAFQNGLERPNIISGMTVYSMLPPMIGLALVLLFFTRSKELRTIAKLGAPGTLFGIHEPLIFGLPVVLNPILAIPFTMSPVICLGIGYLLTVTGIVPIGFGITIPFGTPIILQGLVGGSWKFALVQILLIPVCMLIWYPFVNILDKQKLISEEKIGS